MFRPSDRDERRRVAESRASSKTIFLRGHEKRCMFSLKAISLLPEGEVNRTNFVGKSKTISDFTRFEKKSRRGLDDEDFVEGRCCTGVRSREHGHACTQPDRGSGTLPPLVVCTSPQGTYADNFNPFAAATCRARSATCTRRCSTSTP